MRHLYTCQRKEFDPNRTRDEWDQTFERAFPREGLNEARYENQYDGKADQPYQARRERSVNLYGAPEKKIW